MASSSLERTFLQAWTKYGRGRIPARQFRFTKTRRFRADFAWPNEKLIIEVDGFGGGHQTIVGLSRDHEKSNLAVELGFTVLRYTTRQLGSEAKREEVCNQILKVLARIRQTQ